MAALECNNSVNSFSTSEKRDTLVESKTGSVDYSEDLWLTNSEESLEKDHKIPPQSLTETAQNISNMDAAESGAVSNLEIEGVKKEDPDPEPWAGRMVIHSNTLEPKPEIVNGETGEYSGGETSDEGRRKDFAQLIPAGSYDSGNEGQNKTFTSLMPAAGVGGEETSEVHQGFISMLNANHGQVYYGATSGEEDDDDNAQIRDDNGIKYHANGEMSYSMPEPQTETTENMSGNFTSLSPAVMPGSNGALSEDSAYSSPHNVYQMGVTPKVENNLIYPHETGFSNYPNAASTSSAEDLGQVGFTKQNSFVVKEENNLQLQDGFMINNNQNMSHGYNLLTNIQTHSIPQYHQDGSLNESGGSLHSAGGSNDGEEGLVCSQCNMAFPDQETLDYHINNHPPEKSHVCVTCGKAFGNRRYLKYHRKNHCKRAGSYERKEELDENNEVKRYACEYCGRPFRVLKCLKVHMKKKHAVGRSYMCQACRKSFYSQQELTDHFCLRQEFPPPAPPPPSSTLISTPPSQETTPETPPSATTPLPLPLVAPSPPTPTGRSKKKLKVVKRACDVCGRLFADRISLDIHRVRHLEEELYPCDICSEEDLCENPLHVAVHFKVKPVADDENAYLNDTRIPTTPESQNSVLQSQTASVVGPDLQPAASLAIYNPQGIMVNHTDQTLPLDGNLYIQQHQQQLQQQLQQPNPDLSLANTSYMAQQPQNDMSIMNTYFTGIPSSSGEVIHVGASIPTLQQHTMSSQTDYHPSLVRSEGTQVTEEGVILDENLLMTKKKVKRKKVHTCHLCNKIFVDMAKLELHYKSAHLLDRPFSCDICDHSFYTKWKLQRHMLSHLEQKPHLCTMCPKSFVERGKLEAHMRAHTGYKPFKCEFCAKCFTVKSQLTIHVRRIHSVDQPFACNECGKAFLWKSGLDKHMRKHTNEKPFSCEKCGQAYSQKSNLVMHMGRVHSND